MLTKILIADGNEDFRTILTDELRSNYTVRACSDGVQALEQLHAFRPELLVVDLMLSGIDGLTLLQSAKQADILPPTLVTSPCYSDYVTNTLSQLGVSYMILKPCQLSAVVSRIGDLVHQTAAPVLLHPSSESAITSALLSLGIPTSRKGFRYSRYAIALLLENPNQQITKEVYPAVGKAFGVEPESVEKNIRDAICAAWHQGDAAIWGKFFPLAPNGQVPRPTNSVFLTRVREAVSAPVKIAR